MDWNFVSSFVFIVIGISVLLQEYNILPHRLKGTQAKFRHSRAVRVLGFAFLIGGLLLLFVNWKK